MSMIGGHIREAAGEIEAVMHGIMPEREPQGVYSLAWDFIKRGGKRVRPYLLLASIRAFNGEPERGLEIAAGIEIFHSFTLIHDDIEDNSEMRRGKPCLHITHGVPLAINAGDGMFAHVFRALQMSALSPDEKEKVTGMLADAFISVVDGQGYEISWIHENKWDISEEMYLKMAGGKTAALIAACSKIGAYIGGAGGKEVDEMWSYGYETGLAFQIHDDVLNLVGEEEKYKKEIGGDIREGKRTLIVIHALKTLDPEERDELMGILSKKENTREEIGRAIGLCKKSGSIEYAGKYAKGLVESAKRRLAVVKNSRVKSELEELADLFIKREA